MEVGHADWRLETKEKYRILRNPSETIFCRRDSSVLLHPFYFVKHWLAKEISLLLLLSAAAYGSTCLQVKGRKKLESQPRRQVVIERGVSFRNSTWMGLLSTFGTTPSAPKCMPKELPVFLQEHFVEKSETML